MLLNEEQQKDFKPEQIQVINDAYAIKETELKAEANKNSDGILNGVADKLKTVTGIERNGNDEQVTAYFERLSKEWLPEATKIKITEAEGLTTKAEKERDEWKDKFTNHEGDESIKTELKTAQDEISKIPELLQAKEDEWKGKYDTLESEHNTSKLNRSMSDSMPKFDANVNQFELTAKKENAIERITKGYKLSYDDKGKLIGTKNYKDSLVSELLTNDEELKDLILTDQGQGGGGEGGEKKITKGLNIPENLTKGAAQEIVREYMKTVEGLEKLDPKYSKRFKELCKDNKVL